MLPLAVLLTLAGVALLANAALKIMRFESFVEAVTRYAPSARPSLVAAAWAGAEMTAAVVLVTPLWCRAVPAAWVIGAATGGLARRTRQGQDHDCGCSSRARKIAPTVVRNNCLLLSAVLAGQGAWGGARSAGLGIAGALILFQIGFLAVGSDHGEPPSSRVGLLSRPNAAD